MTHRSAESPRVTGPVIEPAIEPVTEPVIETVIKTVTETGAVTRGKHRGTLVWSITRQMRDTRHTEPVLWDKELRIAGWTLWRRIVKAEAHWTVVITITDGVNRRGAVTVWKHYTGIVTFRDTVTRHCDRPDTLNQYCDVPGHNEPVL